MDEIARVVNGNMVAITLPRVSAKCYAVAPSLASRYCRPELASRSRRPKARRTRRSCEGVTMVADGTGEAELEAVLRHDVLAASDRLRGAAAVLRRAADYAPAMGLIGTLIGLVQMLGQLERTASHRPQHGGRAADDILRRRARQHGVLAAGGEAGAPGRR